MIRDSALLYIEFSFVHISVPINVYAKVDELKLKWYIKSKVSFLSLPIQDKGGGQN